LLCKLFLHKNMEKEGIQGMHITWTQYAANRVNIKIDDGTGNFPWMVAKTLNDGHEFLPNVQSWQDIKIQPVNNCKIGNDSLPISHIFYPDGWFNIK
jgi:hypothetical protein